MTSLAVVVQEEKVSCQERIRKPQKRDWNSKTRKKSKTKKKKGEKLSVCARSWQKRDGGEEVNAKRPG